VENKDNNMVRTVLKSNEYHEYFNSLDRRTQEKYDYTLTIIQTQEVVSEKFVKKIRNSDFYEVRVSIGTNEHRTILVAADNPNFQLAKRVALLNSFLKKDEKQYRREIQKAITIINNMEE
jgi:hypothetical protein